MKRAASGELDLYGTGAGGDGAARPPASGAAGEGHEQEDEAPRRGRARRGSRRAASRPCHHRQANVHARAWSTPWRDGETAGGRRWPRPAGTRTSIRSGLQLRRRRRSTTRRARSHTSPRPPQLVQVCRTASVSGTSAPIAACARSSTISARDDLGHVGIGDRAAQALYGRARAGEVDGDFVGQRAAERAIVGRKGLNRGARRVQASGYHNGRTIARLPAKRNREAATIRL